MTLHVTDDAEGFDEAAFDENVEKERRKQHLLRAGREIDRCAALLPIEYSIERKSVASRLGMRVSDLDRYVDAKRPKGEEDGFMQPHWPVEPAAKPVLTGTLLRQISDRLKQHIIFSDEAASAVALWLAFAWTHGAHTHSPMLLVTSAERDSGKTTLLALVNFLAPRGLMVIDPSAAVLVRMVEKWKPTLIVDEADDQFKQNPTLRSVINSGWTRGAGVPRCHPDTNEPEIFSTFGPKAIGMKGQSIPDTTLSRAIVIEMTRKKPGERVASFEHLDDDGLKDLRQRLSRWANDNWKALISAQPEMPEGFQNRLAANWRPLLAIADLAGGSWPALARAAAVALAPKDTASIGTDMLGDIKTVFANENADRLASSKLALLLHEFEGRPWSEWGRPPKPISANQIARLLKGFGIYPEKIRIGELTTRGYMLHQFDDAFARYLYLEAPGGDPNRNTGTSSITTGISEPFQTGTENINVPVQKREKPNNDGLYSGVPVQKGEKALSRKKNGVTCPKVCVHCGEATTTTTTTSTVMRCNVGGEDFLLHRHCYDDWLQTNNT
jgi:putative DNA primase/helicase